MKDARAATPTGFFTLQHLRTVAAAGLSALLLGSAGCHILPPTTAPAVSEGSAAVTVSLAQVPEAAKCVRVTAAGSGKSMQVSVAGGAADVQVAFAGVPAGAVTFAAQAFRAACAAPATTATWASESISTKLKAGEARALGIALRPVAGADVSLAEESQTND
jgi:hypothetical protein